MKKTYRHAEQLQKEIRTRSASVRWMRELRKTGGMTRKIRRDR